ncbi:MULE domain-containing protein [Aphis craccivora]|uniref:MULE domain-containing protein n=1 Tax=Aphis craccivora TaxID=307492 RepID=A0A6G0YEL3_APHCR|nr:MULE domain-containing protein [Aphis craccivora]
MAAECPGPGTYAECCPSTAIISVDINENWLRSNIRHNHFPPFVDIPVAHLRRTIGIAGTTIRRLSNSIRHIYNNEIVENPDGAKNYTFLQCQSRVRRMRQCRRPQSVDTIEELANILSLNQNKSYASTLHRPPSRIFQETFEADEEVVGVIFFNLDAIKNISMNFYPSKLQEWTERLKQCLNVLLNLTKAAFEHFIKLMHTSNYFVSNWSAPFLVSSLSFPIVYALTSKMTEAASKPFFRVIRRVLPLNYAQLTIITDYERGLMTASVIRYCRRSLNRVFLLFQNNPEANRVLRMVLALPHLPAEIHQECRFTMSDGFRAIIEYVNQYDHISERLYNFLIGYIQRFWFDQIGSASITVFGIKRNVNLHCITLLSQIGRHPNISNIWDYLRKHNTKYQRFKYYVEMDQARRNHSIRNSVTRVNRADAAYRIKNYIQILNKDNYILMFLRRAGHTMIV